MMELAPGALTPSNAQNRGATATIDGYASRSVSAAGALLPQAGCLESRYNSGAVPRGRVPILPSLADTSAIFNGYRQPACINAAFGLGFSGSHGKGGLLVLSLAPERDHEVFSKAGRVEA